MSHILCNEPIQHQYTSVDIFSTLQCTLVHLQYTSVHLSTPFSGMVGDLSSLVSCKAFTNVESYECVYVCVCVCGVSKEVVLVSGEVWECV